MEAFTSGSLAKAFQGAVGKSGSGVVLGKPPCLSQPPFPFLRNWYHEPESVPLTAC